MVTCFATYDAFMAHESLDAVVRVYKDWSQNTVIWATSKTSVSAFHLLANGLVVQYVCRLI